MKKSKRGAENKLDKAFRKNMLAAAEGRRQYRDYYYERIEVGKYQVYDSHGWPLSVVWGSSRDVKEFIYTLTPKGAGQYWEALRKAGCRT